VTKPGGSLYAYVGLSQGIMDRFLLPAWRQAYQEVPEFRAIIDGLTPERMKEYVRALPADAFGERADRGYGRHRIPAFAVHARHGHVFSERVAGAQATWHPSRRSVGARAFEALGFTNVRRVGDRYWQRNDIRKFAAPLHFDHEHPIGRALYGSGHVKLMGEKRA
jgi:hypothetical protein